MPNQNSKANHTPVRTCLVCRTRAAKEDLYPMLWLEGGLVFDLNNRLGGRKAHVCHEVECLSNLDKKYKKSKRRSVIHA